MLTAVEGLLWLRYCTICTICRPRQDSTLHACLARLFSVPSSYCSPIPYSILVIRSTARNGTKHRRLYDKHQTLHQTTPRTTNLTARGVACTRMCFNDETHLAADLFAKSTVPIYCTLSCRGIYNMSRGELVRQWRTPGPI